MPYFTYALKLIFRNRRRTLTYLFGLVLAVGLLSSILFFVDASARRMTQTAVAPVVVDMQVRSTLAHPDLTPVADALRREPFVAHVESLTIADFASLSVPGTNHTTSSGKLFVLEPSYLSAFSALRLLSGRADSSGVLISQAAANDLGLSIGNTVAVNFDQMATPYQAKITGIVDPSGAYFMFAATDPAHEGEFNPVPNDVFITPARWQADLAGQLTNPPAPSDPNAKPIPAQKPQYELHVETDHRLLPSDPTKASVFVDTLRRRMEKQFPGEIKITNNLADALKRAKSDVLWAKLLFLFLGMPGVALAAYLSKYATDLLTGPQRQEIGLLRARGATPHQIMLAMGTASVLIALAGTVLGIVAGLGSTVALFGTNAAAPAALLLHARSAVLAFVAGLLLTGLATFLPIRATLNREISQERRQTEHQARPPFWARAYLDAISLAVAGLIFWVTGRGGGFKPIEGAEGTSLSLGFFVFLAPFFLWLGLTLLLGRVTSSGVTLSAGPLRRVLGGLFGDLGRMAGKSITRRAPKIASAVIIVALALSFGTSVSIFVHTYQVQKTVDARYELGSDIKLTPASSHQQTAAFATEVAAVPGVSAVSAIQRTQAYVGSNLQTIFGIDAQTFDKTTQPADSFFVDLTALQVRDTLAATPNGVLVGQELAAAYDIRPGDPVIIRLLDTTSNQYVETRLQSVGTIRFFPTTQQDSFLVMSRALMQQVTHSDKVNYFLVKTVDAPRTVATRLQQTLGSQFPLKTEDIETAILALGSSMTSLNLRGLGRIEQLYTVIIISLGLGIFLLAMIYERAREFGTMRALGGTSGQLGRILWSESLTVGVLSVLIGSVTGLVLGRVFVSMLSVLYTIPPSGMSVPWGTLVLLLGLGLAGMTAASLVARRRLARMEVAAVLREL